jgi:hypothetical protein
LVCRLDLLTPHDYTVADLNTLQITTAYAKPSQSAFISHFAETDLNDEDSSASVLTSLLSGEHPTAKLNSILVPLITRQHEPCKKHHLQQLLVVVRGLVATGTHLFVKVLLSNSCIYLLIKNLLPSSGCCFMVCFTVVTQ